MWSHATVFWDDEMESFGTGGFDALPTNNGNGHVVDTAIKFSGNGRFDTTIRLLSNNLDQDSLVVVQRSAYSRKPMSTLAVCIYDGIK